MHSIGMTCSTFYPAVSDCKKGIEDFNDILRDSKTFDFINTITEDLTVFTEKLEEHHHMGFGELFGVVATLKKEFLQGVEYLYNLNSLLGFVAQLSGILQVRPLKNMIQTITHDLINFDTLSVLLLDPSKGTYSEVEDKSLASWHITHPFFEELKKGPRFQVVESSESHKFNQGIKELLGTHVTGYCTLQLTSKDELKGVVVFSNRYYPIRPISKDKECIVEFLAQTIYLTMKSAIYYEGIKDHQKYLKAFSNVSRADPDGHGNLHGHHPLPTGLPAHEVPREEDPLPKLQSLPTDRGRNRRYRYLETIAAGND